MRSFYQRKLGFDGINEHMHVWTSHETSEFPSGRTTHKAQHHSQSVKQSHCVECVSKGSAFCWGDHQGEIKQCDSICSAVFGFILQEKQNLVCKNVDFTAIATFCRVNRQISIGPIWTFHSFGIFLNSSFNRNKATVLTCMGGSYQGGPADIKHLLTRLNAACEMKITQTVRALASINAGTYSRARMPMATISMLYD